MQVKSAEQLKSLPLASSTDTRRKQTKKTKEANYSIYKNKTKHTKKPGKTKAGRWPIPSTRGTVVGLATSSNSPSPRGKCSLSKQPTDSKTTSTSDWPCSLTAFRNHTPLNWRPSWTRLVRGQICCSFQSLPAFDKETLLAFISRAGSFTTPTPQDTSRLTADKA